MRCHLGLYVLFQPLSVSCVEGNLSQVKDSCHIADVDFLCSPKGIRQPGTPEFLASNVKLELDPSAGINRDSKLETQAEIKPSFAATTVDSRHRDSDFGYLAASSRQEVPHNSINEINSQDPYVRQIHNSLSYLDSSTDAVKSFWSKPPTARGHTSGKKAPLSMGASQELIERRILKSARRDSKGRSGVHKHEDPAKVIIGVSVNELNLPARAVAGLPRAQELRDWFRIAVLTGGKLGEPILSQDIRKQLVKKIARFEKIYRQALLVSRGDMEMESALLYANDFGQQCLKILTVETPIRKEKIELLSTNLKNQLKAMNVSEKDHFEKFFYWPIILAGSREWYYREVSSFSEYLKALTPIKTDKEKVKTHPAGIQGEGSLEKEPEEICHAGGVRIVLKILGKMEDMEDVNDWQPLYNKLLSEGNYYKLNTTIENFIYMNFHQELARFNGNTPNTLNFSQSKLAEYEMNWGMKEGNILALFKVYHDSITTRGKYTMNGDISDQSYTNYGQSLVKLAKDILSKQSNSNYPIDAKSISQLIRKLYGWIEKEPLYLPI